MELIWLFELILLFFIIKWKMKEGYPDANDLKIEEEIHNKRASSFLMNYTGNITKENK